MDLRHDPATGRWVAVAPGRIRRPGGAETPAADREAACPFCAGHEDQTPPEVYAVRPNGGAPDSPGWTVRVVPNKYPALDPESQAPAPFAKPDLFTATPARGT